MTGAATDASRRRAWIALIVTALVLEALYVFMVSAGLWTRWSFYVRT